MTTPTDITPGRNTKDLAARIGWGVLIVATLYVCYFSHLGAIGFVGPDEPRYAWIARDMAETGDWVTPRLYGKPWFEKPPLYYWGAAACFKLFGVGEAAARLPSAICALLATLAMAWLAWRIYGAETARWLLLLLPTTVGMIGFSHAAATDMPFSAMLTIAMVCAAVLLRLPLECGSPPLSRNETVAIKLPEPPPAPSAIGTQSVTTPFAKSSWLAAILFGFFLGLAVLAKGPAGIILCGGAIFFWALFTKRWRDTLRLLHPAAIIAFCATALPWYILCARRNPDFFRVFIIEHNFKRFLTPEFQHIQPFWFYIPILLVGLFPWVGIAISSVMYVFTRKLGMHLETTSAYILSWAFFPVIFFTVSKSKLPGYILPAIPAILLLTAVALTRMLRLERVPVPLGFAIIALTPVVAILALALLGYFEHFGKAAGKEMVFRVYGVECFLLGCGAILAISLLFVRKKYSGVILSGALAWICLLILTYFQPLPTIDSWFSARAVASTVLRDSQMAADVRTLGLQRAWQFGLNFYLHRPLQEWDISEPRGYVFASASGMEELNRKRLRFEVLNETSFQAFLIRVGGSQNGPLNADVSGVRKETVEMMNRERLPSHPPGSGQPQ